MSEDEPLETRVRAAQQKVHEIKRRRRRSRILGRSFLVVALLGGGVAAWFTWSATPEPPAPGPVERAEVPSQQLVRTPKPEAPPSVAVEPPPPATAPEEAAPPLPPLSASDPMVRDLAGDLSIRDELDEWLLANDLIWRFTISVINLAEGTSPRHQLSRLAPREEFEARVTEGRITTDPASFTRYDTLVDVFTSLHARASVRLYERLAPLIDEAFADLGFPDESFEATMTRGIHELLLAPRIQGVPELTLGVVSYEYLDPRLEALSPAQKQLLRMGPDNVGRVQDKLRELAHEMGIPASELPAPAVYQASSG